MELAKFIYTVKCIDPREREGENGLKKEIESKLFFFPTMVINKPFFPPAAIKGESGKIGANICLHEREREREKERSTQFQRRTKKTELTEYTTLVYPAIREAKKCK